MFDSSSQRNTADAQKVRSRLRKPLNNRVYFKMCLDAKGKKKGIDHYRKNNLKIMNSIKIEESNIKYKPHKDVKYYNTRSLNIIWYFVNLKILKCQ